MSSVDGLIQAIATAQDSQLDAIMKQPLLDLIGEDDATAAACLKKILDQCAYSALASDFVMLALHGAWQAALEASAKTPNA